MEHFCVPRALRSCDIPVRARIGYVDYGRGLVRTQNGAYYSRSGKSAGCCSTVRAITRDTEERD